MVVITTPTLTLGRSFAEGAVILNKRVPPFLVSKPLIKSEDALDDSHEGMREELSLELPSRELT